MSVFVIIAVMIMAAVYHNGMRSDCPFCISGTYYSDRMTEDIVYLIESKRSFSSLLNNEQSRVLPNLEREVASRAPPVLIRHLF